MLETIDGPTADFKHAAADTVAEKANATLEIDPDIADYLKSQFPEGWQAHANDLLRFFMETSQQKEREFENVFAQPEPRDMQEPEGPDAPALTPI